VSSCDSIVRVRGRTHNASVTRVPVGRRRYVRAETKPLVVVVLMALACTATVNSKAIFPSRVHLS